MEGSPPVRVRRRSEQDGFPSSGYALLKTKRYERFDAHSLPVDVDYSFSIGLLSAYLDRFGECLYFSVLFRFGFLFLANICTKAFVIIFSRC